MKANVIEAHGPARNVFQIREMPEPAATADDLILKVLTTSVNPLDCRIRTRASVPRTFPLILGFDVCGIVVEKGSNVKGFEIGDRVLGSPTPFRSGANAEFVAIDYRSCALAGSLSDEQAAALPLVGITAFEALFGRLRVRSGDLVVIHAGAGGVGHIAVQLARYAGCKVITTAGRDESIGFCARQSGADYILNYRTQDIREAVTDISEGRGAALVLDTVGGDTFGQCIEYTAYNGHICTILPVAISEQQGYRALLKNLTISYQFMGGPLQNPAHNQQGMQLQRLVESVENGTLRPHVSEVYAFEDLPIAHEQIETGRTLGKIVVRVGR